MRSVEATPQVLVLGGTGRAGLPAVRAFLAAGNRVRVLARHAGALPSGVEFIQGSVTDAGTVERAMAGCSGVHFAVAGGHSRETHEAIEVGGMRNVVAAARKTGTRLVTMVSGSTTSEANAWFYGTRAKLDSERVLTDSGLPHLIIRSSWMMESLPGFVRGTSASLVGRVRTPFRWVGAEDIGAAVARAHGTKRIDTPVLYAYGPEQLTLEEALRRYVAARVPGGKLAPTPIPMLWLIGALTGKPELRHFARFMRFFERAEPEPTGVPTIPAPTSLDRYLAADGAPARAVA